MGRLCGGYAARFLETGTCAGPRNVISCTAPVIVATPCTRQVFLVLRTHNNQTLDSKSACTPPLIFLLFTVIVIELTLTLHNLLVSAIVLLHDTFTFAAQHRITPTRPVPVYRSPGRTTNMYAPLTVVTCLLPLYTLFRLPPPLVIVVTSSVHNNVCLVARIYTVRCRMTHFLLLLYRCTHIFLT